MCDLVAANCALLVTLAVRPHYGIGWTTVGEHPVWFALLSIVWLALGHAFDIYDPRVTNAPPATVPRLVKAGFLAGLTYLMIPFLPPPLPTSRLVLVLFLAAVVTLPLVMRGMYFLVLAQPFSYRRAVIVGGGYAGQIIAEALRECGKYELVGFVDDCPAQRDGGFPGDRAHGGAGDPPRNRWLGALLGDRRALRDVVARYRVDTIVLANSCVNDREFIGILMDCLEHGVELLPMCVLYEQLTGRVPLECIGDDWWAALPIHHPGTKGLYPLAKRLIDVLVGLAGVGVLAAVTPVVALATWLDCRGPVLYWQSRVGKGGQVFKLYKFRSMIPNAEQGGPVWARRRDPRVTRVGRILRATHLDELPQFVNVLKGEMSLVGPRPERPEFVAELSKQIPYYRVRLAVKPGLAGWSLVKQGYSASAEDALPKLQYDLYWIKHQSLWLDTVILLKALGDVLTLGGR